MQAKTVLGRLRAMGNPEVVENKARRFGINPDNALGINQQELKLLAREIGRNSELGLALFDSGIYEARLLCSKVFEPTELTPELMDVWAASFETWEICDSFCMGLFVHGRHADTKIIEWAMRPELFVKRAAFAMMAAYGFANKQALNHEFEAFLPLVVNGALDDRHYVKKSVSWALRNIGKRNPDLRTIASSLAAELAGSKIKSQQWVGTDASRELQGDGLRLLNYPRSLYGPRS